LTVLVAYTATIRYVAVEDQRRAL